MISVHALVRVGSERRTQRTTTGVVRQLPLQAGMPHALASDGEDERALVWVQAWHLHVRPHTPQRPHERVPLAELKQMRHQLRLASRAAGAQQRTLNEISSTQIH